VGVFAARGASRARARIAAVALAIGALGGAARAEPTEPEVKAEFVERFIRFVDWDPKSLGDEFVACVVGDSPIAPYLARIAKARKLKDRPASVVQVAPDGTLASCHAVLIGALDKKQLAAVVGRTAGRPVLTIADSPGAADAGAIINFYEEDGHVKYEINVRAADDSGLVLRAKLLKLARIVGERERRGGG
jgi:hypothetical protein